jgi:drug/metabolite transporter (DMT)-like permease
MIIQIGPVIVALLAVPLFGERMHAWLLGGMLVGFAGVAVIARGSSSDADASLLGVGLVLVAAVMYAVGVLTQKVLLRRLPSVQVVFVSFLMGALICLPFSSDLPGIVAGGGAELWWIVYLGVFPTAVAFTTWAYALTHTDAGALSLTTFLVPGIATLVAWLTINEVPPTLSFVGGALAIVGVLMTRRKPRTRDRVS